MVLLTSPCSLQRVHYISISIEKSVENVKSKQMTMIFRSEVPAQRIYQMDVLRGRAEGLMFQHGQDTLENLDELVLNSTLRVVAAAIEASQIVLHLDFIVAEGALQPLHDIKEAILLIAQVHRKVEQVQTGGATQTIDQARFNALLELLARDGGLQDSKHGEGTRLERLNPLVGKAVHRTGGFGYFLPLTQSISPIKRFIFLPKLTASD